MDNISVLHVLNSAHGGSALSTFELIEALRERGVKSSLVCFNNASAEQRKKISSIVEGRVLFIPLYWMNKKIRAALWKRPLLEGISIWKTWYGFKHQSQIDKLIKAEGINVVHTSTSLNPEGAIAARRNQLYHIWHVRELIGSGMYFQFPFQKFWNRFVTQYSNRLVANSSITFNHLLNYFSREKIVVVPNGINVHSFSCHEHQPGKPLVVAMLGNVTSRLKNHKFFIRTASEFQKTRICEFRIYGTLPSVSDPYYNQLRQLVEQQNLVGIVTFEGDQLNAREIMQEVDVLFHPTPNESFGRVFIEAMASCVPVVAVNQGGALELVKDGVNGFLISNDDCTEAARRIQELIESPERRIKMGRAGREMVVQEYTLDKLADRMLLLYEEGVEKSIIGE